MLRPVVDAPGTGRADHGDASRLYGWAGNDVLFGEAGNDALNCGANFDSANGGSGADIQTLCEVITQIR